LILSEVVYKHIHTTYVLLKIPITMVTISRQMFSFSVHATSRVNNFARLKQLEIIKAIKRDFKSRNSNIVSIVSALTRCRSNVCERLCWLCC